ncbi:hypothetical protein RP20_CCG007211 [Aedes albopictus]|nr:hypothetical protein RP20_CCG007211 [Aedes albopictus]
MEQASGNQDGTQNQNDAQNQVLLLQTATAFNPAAYNLPQFRYKHLPSSEVRNAWNGWIRGFERVMKASSITDGSMKKIQMLAMGGLELQNVFDGIPGADEESEESADPFAVARTKLDNHFSPKQHESFERYLFWMMSPETEEPIKKFVERVQQKAEKCAFGKTSLESRQIAVVDKIIQYAPGDLREKLLEKEHLTLDDCIKVVNSHQAVKYQASKMSEKSGTPLSTNVQKLYANSGRRNFVHSDSFQRNSSRCTKCGYNQHKPGERCPALNQLCVRCRGVGHFKAVCRSTARGPTEPSSAPAHLKRPYPTPTTSRNMPLFKKPRNVMHIETPEENNMESDEEELPVYNVGDNDELIQCKVGGVGIEMLIDSGSKYNLIDDATWSTMKMRNVQASNIRFDASKKFLAYGKVPLKLIAVFDAEIEILGTDRKLAVDTTFYVIEQGQQPLLGKLTAQQLGVLRIGLGSIEGDRVAVTKQHFPFIRDVELTLPIDRSVPPVIQPLRRCPVPLLDKVKAKLDDLLCRVQHSCPMLIGIPIEHGTTMLHTAVLAQDIIERVEKPTSWVSPLVPILKDNGDLRMCIDMRRANQAIQRLNHPLPVFEEILPRIRNARYYSLLDMKESYYHVMLTEGCRDVTTFITNWGLYRFKRLFFGVNCAPELFQSLMESLLANCPNLIGFIDDFLVFGETEEAHDKALETVVRRFEELGVQLNHQKCKFKQLEVIDTGFRRKESFHRTIRCAPF